MRRKRRNHSASFKAKVAVAAVRGRRGGLHRLHEPAPRAHLDELADARGTFGQQAGSSRAQWSSAQGSGQRVRLARTV